MSEPRCIDENRRINRKTVATGLQYVEALADIDNTPSKPNLPSLFGHRTLISYVCQEDGAFPLISDDEAICQYWAD